MSSNFNEYDRASLSVLWRKLNFVSQKYIFLSGKERKENISHSVLIFH